MNTTLGLSPPNEQDAPAQQVLDIGTGTGIWAIDYADAHPDSTVIGVDLSPIQPTLCVNLPKALVEPLLQSLQPLFMAAN
jgi:tRNA G46 methylase TrmB